MKPEDLKWVRKQFRSNKVWVAANAQGEPIVENNKALIKYQLDQPHQYWVKFKALGDIPEGTPDRRVEKAGTAAPKRINRKKKSAAPEPVLNGEPPVIIYTDGASSGNPGPSGIGVVMEYRGKTREISSYIGISTNNIAELTAVQAALEALKRHDLPVHLHTDSSYVCGLLTSGWQAKKNVALVAAIKDLMSRFPRLRIIKVAGHNGIPGNERADQLATAAIASRNRDAAG